MHFARRVLFWLGFSMVVTPVVSAARIRADLSAVRQGAIHVSSADDVLTVDWKDAKGHAWKTVFSLESKDPLIRSISADGSTVVAKATPYYRCTTGVRTGGWDAFFDFPPASPQGTRTFLQEFHPTAVTASMEGDRVNIDFNGMQMGIFSGTLRYVFYPGSALVQQVAVLQTSEPDVAYIYDTGIQITSEEDRSPGLNMASNIVYYDEDSKLQSITSPYGSERRALKVHYRAVAAKSGSGSIVAFPAPHRYLFARDYTTNMGYAWYSAWRGHVGLGIEQPVDDNTTIYPWINAPAGSKQEMGIFFLLGAGAPQQALDQVLEYTHRDRFQHLDGYITFAPHWHLAYTEQAIAHGKGWVPPFKPEMEKTGIDAAMIMDFHIDGHPSDPGETRLREIAQYYQVCRELSDKSFLLIPAEEANYLLGGHWSVTFPKQVNWIMGRKPDDPFLANDPRHGAVYRVGDPGEIWDLVKKEHGYVYLTHPRTKGSTGYPEKILNTAYFRDPQYFGTGWKAMPSDLSLPELGMRAFKTVDDLNNLGLHKVMLGEVDVFQLSSTDELYAHMNINYLPMKQLPDFDHYSSVLDAAARGEGFISTGEVLLHEAKISAQGDSLHVTVNASSTFPLRLAEVVWGDSQQTHTETFPLLATHEFETKNFDWNVSTRNWKWARIAIWDIAGGGAFTNPTWKAHP